MEPAFVGLQRLNIFLATGNRHPAGTPGPDQWVLMGVQACRLPGLKPLKPLQRCKILLLRPTPQAQATPRPHQWLLMGVQACRLPGLKPLKPFQRFQIFLARPTPQATGTPRPDQWLPFAILSTLTTLQNLLGTPSRAGNRHPKARSMASHGRSSMPLAT